MRDTAVLVLEWLAAVVLLVILAQLVLFALDGILLLWR